MNVVTLLQRAAERAPERVALALPDDSATFGALWERVDRTSRGLRERGAARGERVIVMVPMSIALYQILLALLEAGAAAVFVDPWLARDRIAAFAVHADPLGFVGIPKAHLLRWSDRRLRRLPLSVTTGRRWWRVPAGVTLDELAAEPGGRSVEPVGHGDAALITFTTGSSGAPKGANRTHGFLAAQHAALKTAFPYEDGDVDLTAFPVFALNNLALGITTVVPPVEFSRVADADPSALHAHAWAHGVTTCTLSPPLLDRLADGVERHGPLGLRRILVGGAPVGDDQLGRWIDTFAGTEIVVVYGSTEAEPVAHIEARARLAVHREAANDDLCVGAPIAAIDARVVRIHPGAISLGAGGWGDWDVDGIGELVVAGDHVCGDYYRSPDATAAAKIRDADGRTWHRMGDTGYLDREGRFWLVGRVHSTITRGGESLHPQRIERAARRLAPACRQVAAVGMPGDGDDQRLVVVVHGDVAPQQWSRLEEGLAERGFAPDELVADPAPLPVDPRHNAKIDYAALRARLGARA